MGFKLSTTALLLIPLLPLLGSMIVGVLGTAMGGYLIGRKTCAGITIMGVGTAFILSIWTLWLVLQGAYYNQTLYEWLTIGSFTLEIGFLIDSLSAIMMCVVTFVSLMVHIYTMGYMVDDPGYRRFFAYISLFTFAMLMLVMSNNTLQLFFGWEAVGLVSYLLIGFWYKKPTAIFANLKAFLINRVGDFGFILGIGLLAVTVGSFDYQDTFRQVGLLQTQVLAGTNWSLVTVVCLLLFIGAMAKSAQFPLHAWLPDSMEGPTPISALIHAATMVTAGIFMVARFSPVYELSDTALNFILVIGTITTFFMGILGVIQNDIKRVIAYSTLSQLGYMTVALGVSAYSVAVFHLMTHAFFKALLFLGAGSVIIGMHHKQDMRQMGGLSRYMPITWLTTLVGCLALIGTPLFSGFYSKESIIMAVAGSQLPTATWAYWLAVLSVFVTALYTFRMYFMVFHGQERFREVFQKGKYSGYVPCESPWVVWLPLVLLAIPSATIGYFTIQPMLFGRFFDQVIFVNSSTHQAMQYVADHFHSATAMALHAFVTVPFWLALAGVLVAYIFYLKKPSFPQHITHRITPLMSVLEHKYYVDWFNKKIIAQGSRQLGHALWRLGDQKVIDGFLVNGSWKIIAYIAGVVRKLQTGYLHQYAMLTMLAILVMA
jgi:NADH-quinone oxidoreductase subunit L